MERLVVRPLKFGMPVEEHVEVTFSISLFIHFLCVVIGTTKWRNKK